jgi:hypothetical protein
LYVASGLAGYSNEVWPDARRQLLDGYAREVLYKERLLQPGQLAGLSSEQRAAVDFLVLASSRRLVGFSASTFSWLLREYRALWRLAPRSSMLMAHLGKVGNGRLFSRAAVLAV